MSTARSTSQTTDPAHMDKDALEHEIEETRDALVGTVDAIVDRVDPGKAIERNTEQLKRDAKRTAADVQVRAREVQTEVEAYVREDPTRASMLAGGVVGVLLLAYFLGRRQVR